LEQAASFYHYKEEVIKVNTFIVWRPTKDNDSAFILNDFIILKIPSEKKIDNSSKRIAILSSILMHEIMHYFSNNLIPDINECLKLAIERKLQKYLNNIIPNLFIEEPLAVILGQQVYMKHVYPQFYDIYDNVYENAWVRTLSILTQPLVESYLNANKPIDENFINRYIFLSDDVLSALNSLRSAEK